jgi:hypothetical protein
MANAIPNLYLKWIAVKELLNPRSNAEIATGLWGPDDGPSKFSKMLRGDYGCEPDVASELAEIVNKRLIAVRAVKGRSEPPRGSFRGSDFELPVLEFTRRIVEAAEVIDADTLARAHKALMSELTVEAGQKGGPQLAIEKFSISRFFEGVETAAEGPPVFEIGRDKGLFAVDGLADSLLRRPMKAYAVFARDPTPAGGWLWETQFGQTVRWLPSPFAPIVEKDRVLLMNEPKPVQPVVGHFHVTVVLVFDDAAIGRLDPRGSAPPSQGLDEEETARFLTNLSRVAKSHPKAMALCAGEYVVREPKG